MHADGKSTLASVSEWNSERSITWVGPIVSSWAIGDPQIVNHDEEGAEICAALRFSWFSYDDVMQNMVHKANQQVINGNRFKSITKPSKLERGTT